MRTSAAVLVGVALVLAAACSSSDPRPAPVRTYGPEATGWTARAPEPAPEAWPAEPAPPAEVGGWSTEGLGFQWHMRLADAQEEARTSGKLILCMSTKPGCTLCDKFKNQIVPQTIHRVQPMAVGYVYNILQPETRAVDRTLRANLRGADLMPLVGFLTPDLNWVHGFWGARTVAQFRGDIQTASRIYPVSSARVARKTEVGETMATVVNEYGEPEWSLPSDVWPEGEPEPIDAITGSPELADAMPAPEPETSVVTPPTPVAALAPAVPAPPPPPADVPYVGIQAPVDAAPAPAKPGWSEPAAERSASEVASADSPETWGDRALASALADIRGGRFDEARATLDEIQARLPDTTHAREAARGGVALYNTKRIRNAPSGSEHDRYVARARRDLGKSMWGPLFDS